MAFERISEVVSSRTGLRIADLVSRRPRTLNELGDLTGFSIQAVLKHLKKLEGLGLVEGRKVRGSGVSVRKVYYPGKLRVGDFSGGELVVVKLSEPASFRTRAKDAEEEMELLAEEALVQRTRIAEQVRKLGRMIDDLVDVEESLGGILESLSLGDDERLILYALFTEDTLEEGVRVLSRYYGLKEGRKSIDKALAKAKRFDKK